MGVPHRAPQPEEATKRTHVARLVLLLNLHVHVCWGQGQGQGKSDLSAASLCSWPCPQAAWAGVSLLQARTAAGAAPSLYHTVLEVETSDDPFAWTTTGALVSFELNGSWTDDEVLFQSAEVGEVVRKAFNVPSWPSRLRLSAGGTDAWGYSRILLRWDRYVLTLLDPSTGNLSYGPGSLHWVDSDEEAPVNNTYKVSSIPWQKRLNVSEDEDVGNHTDAGNHTEVLSNHSSVPEVLGNCTTRFDPRASAIGYTTSPPGTPCIFGLDARDEGSHCILDDGSYGSLGWCYTSSDASSFGSCGEACPLFGPFQTLGNKIDALREAMAGAADLPDVPDVEVNASNITPNMNVTLPANTSDSEVHKH